MPDIQQQMQLPIGEWVDRYLTLLRLAAEAPGLEALGRLTRAHLCTIPFENVTAILRRRENAARLVPPVDPNALLESWERGGGGVWSGVQVSAG
jgi:arylamine N-acetyltransferase